MGKVYQINDIIFKIIAGDHLPAHVHVIKKTGEKEAKITIEDQIVLENHGYNNSDLKAHVATVKEYKEDFLEEWRKCNG